MLSSSYACCKLYKEIQTSHLISQLFNLYFAPFKHENKDAGTMNIKKYCLLAGKCINITIEMHLVSVWNEYEISYFFDQVP